MRHRIVQAQGDILRKAISFLRNKDSRFLHYGVTNPENYLSIWAVGSLGALRVHCLRRGRAVSFSILWAYIKNVIALGYQAHYSFDKLANNKAYKCVVISWCTAADFLPEGSVRSAYFNCTTDYLDESLWVMLPLDGATLKNKNDNISFFCRKKRESFSVFCFFENLLFCLRRGISPSPEGLYAQKFAEAFLLNIDMSTVEQILIPYEGQPWQHTLTLLLKRAHENIKVLGDIHSCLPPLPTDFIKRKGAPDTVIVHGRGQKELMVRSLGWQADEIKILPSLRFSKESGVDLRQKILLPYSFGNVEMLLEHLDVFYKNCSHIIPMLTVRNHPAQLSSPVHLAFMRGVQEVQARYNRSSANVPTDIDVVVVIGASSAIIECLQRGMRVFQIAEDPVFDSYNPEIWAGIEVKYLERNIVEYSLSHNREYLEFGGSDISKVFRDA